MPDSYKPPFLCLTNLHLLNRLSDKQQQPQQNLKVNIIYTRTHVFGTEMTCPISKLSLTATKNSPRPVLFVVCYRQMTKRS